MENKAGFTLLELSVSMVILSVVGFLTFVVTQSTTSAAAVSEAKEQVQATIRNTLSGMSEEIQLAAKMANLALVPPLQALTVVSPTEITFQIPTNQTGSQWSTVITYRFENEDKNNNAMLDNGEDTNEDGALTRRILRIQGDTSHSIGVANDVSNVQFALNPTNDVLTITLTATKAVQNRRHDLIRASASTQVYLLN